MCAQVSFGQDPDCSALNLLKLFNQILRETCEKGIAVMKLAVVPPRLGL